MPRFLEMERKQRSVTYAMWSAARRAGVKRAVARVGVCSSRWPAAWAELVDAIAHRLPEGCIRLNSRVEAVRFDDREQNWRITLDRNDTIEAGAVILATPRTGPLRC